LGSLLQFALGLGEHLTKGGEVVFRDFFTLHEASDEGCEAAVENAVEETDAFLMLALILSDGGCVAELAADGFDGQSTFVGESTDEGLHGAGFPVQAAFEFLHDITEGASAAFPKDLHDGPFGVGNAGRGGNVVFVRHEAGLQV